MIPKPKNRTRWGAIVQSWAFIQEQADTERCYALSDKQAAGLRSIAAYLGWPNRYSDNPLPDWLDTSEYRANIEAALLQPLECDDMKLRQSPTNYCIMQVSYDGGTTWQTAFNYALCSLSPKTILLKWTIEDGYQASFDGGETWVDGADYDPRASATLFPLPVIPEGQDPQCLAANNVVAELKQNVEDITTQLRNLSGITGLSGAFGALMTLIFAGAPIAGITWVIASAAAAIIGYTASAFSGAFTGEVWDTVFSIVYCSSNDEMAYDESQFNTIYSQIGSALTGIADLHLRNVLGLVGYAGLTNIARIDHDVYEDANCVGCAWCYTIDFTATDGGFTALVNANGTYGYHTAAGWLSAWFGTAEFTYQQNCYISRSLVATITEATIEFTSPNGCTMALAVNGSTVLAETYFSSGSQSLVWTGEQAISSITLTDYRLNQTELDNIAITRLTLHGTGTNPFGGDNCT